MPLPAYQTPSFPLTPAARDELSLLLNAYPSNHLITNLKKASDNLTDRAGDINDDLYDVQKASTSKRRRREKDGEPPDEDAEAHVKEYGERVEGLTAKMEAAVRKAIDGQAGVEALQKALKEVHYDSANAGPQAGLATQQTQATTQATTQAITTQGSAMDVDGENGEDGAKPAAPAPPPLTPSFESALQKQIDRYAAKPMSHRYASHNSYIGFKQTIFDSYHASDGKMLPHKSTWFRAQDGGADGPPPGVTSTNGASANDDEDDDMAIAHEKISTTCPLTLKEFEDPITSAKCPHSFERAGFEDLLRHARPQTQGQGRGRNAPPPLTGVQCPVAGCDQRLEKGDVESNAVVVRRIRRLQGIEAARRERFARGGSASGDEGGAGGRGLGGSHVIESGSESGEDDSADDVDAVESPGRRRARTKTPAIKRERMRRARGGMAGDDIEDDGSD